MYSKFPLKIKYLSMNRRCFQVDKISGLIHSFDFCQLIQITKEQQITALKCLIINLFNYLSLYLYTNLSDKYGGLPVDSYSILQRWKNYFCLIFNMTVCGRLNTFS